MALTGYYDSLTAVTIAATATEAQQLALQNQLTTILGPNTDPASEVTGLQPLIKALIEQLKGDKAIAPVLWEDDTGFFYRIVAFNQETNAFEYTTVDLTGAAYTVGANPRIPGAPVDRDVQLVAATYDAGSSTGLSGFVQLLYDHSTTPTAVTQLGVLDSSYAPVAAPTNVQERPPETEKFWNIQSEELITLATDDATPTTLTVPTALAAVPDQDLQVTLTINPNADILTVFNGGTVSGISSALANAVMNDTVRWSNGAALSANVGQRWGVGNEELTITGRPNIVSWQGVNTSANHPATLNAQWAQRV